LCLSVSAGLFTALVVALDAVAWESFEDVARSEAEAIAQPLDLADTILDRAVKDVSLTARHDGVLRLHQKPFTLHHTCTDARTSSSVIIIIIISSSSPSSQ